MDELVGTTLMFGYESETYRVEILDEERLRWTRTAGEDVGRGDVERYVASPLGEGVFLVTWIEADGLGLSNVIDLPRGVLTTHANQEREVFENPGSVSTEG